MHTRTISIGSDRRPVPRNIFLGMEGDNRVERLEFTLPRIAEHQTATLMIGGVYANAVLLENDGGKSAYIDLTQEIIGVDGVVDAYVRIDGSGGEVWQSHTMRMSTGSVPNVENEIEMRFPTAVETMLGEIADHREEMSGTLTSAQEAARQAQDAAKRAEDAAGMISPGGGIMEESDPTVPEWAKQPNKPSYTPEEIGAQPKGDYALRDEIPDVPDKVSAFENDAGYLTGIPGEYVTEAELAQKGFLTEHQDLSDYAKRYEIPDTSAFITRAVSDLENYYRKSETYTREEIDQRISAIPKFTIAVVSSLPSANISETTIYLLPGGSDGDLYTEYIYTNGAWEILGSQRVDLTGYATQTWTLEQLAGYQPKGSYLTAVPDEYVTEAELNAKGYLTEHQDISGKLDADRLPEAVNIALAQAKESGEFDGYTPVRYKDYWTEEDREAITEEVRNQLSLEIADELAKRGQLKPEFANDISECIDTSKLYVLPDGYIYAYMTQKVTTPGGTVPNFTNLLDDANAVVKSGYRYSASSAAWREYDGTSYIVPIPTGNVTIRVRKFYANGYVYMYVSADGNTFRDVGVTFTDVSGGSNPINTDGIAVYNNTSDAFVTFCCASGYVEIVTANEEITYTETSGGTEYVTNWANTGHAFVPADYEDRIIEMEDGLADVKEDIDILREKVENANAATAFSSPAYCPTPQLPADGSEGSDFNINSVTTQDAYDYMDVLCGKYTNYIHNQTMGRDASGEFDHNRYILSKAYWRAWQKRNYPRMFAWQNGSTMIYSVSVSPRVGDAMYTTPYVGTIYSTVTAVNSAAQTASTRTVNGLVFTRYADGDIEPTVVYTKVPVGPTIYHIERVYDSAFSQVTTIDTLGDDHFVGADGVTYTRYPFEDRRMDKSKPLSVFILANEHGLLGDSLIPSFVLMRMAKDLCRNTENSFLKWLKENCMITMIPVGNPWGYAKYLEKASGYYNSNGVNINRNYDTPGWSTSDTNYGDVETFGAYPGSEIETQHIMDTIQLCKAKVGMSMHGLGVDPNSEMAQQPDNGYFIHQGCGYDPDRVEKIAEALYSSYNLGMDSDTAQSNSAQNCGKSPAYIQYAGAVGGLTETISWEAGTAINYNAMAMEQAYSQLLMFLQNWCEEALMRKE